MTITVTQNAEVYELRFKYDAQAIEMIKELPGRRWNSEEKLWTLPKQYLGLLIKKFENTPYELKIYSDEDIDVNAKVDEMAEIPDIDLTGVPFYVKEGSRPYKHQLDFMKYAIKNDGKGFILADDMRLGKTIELLNLGIYRKRTKGYKHCLIICCINTSKYNWLDDINVHLRGEEEGYILGTRKKKNGELKYGGSLEKWYDLDTMCKYGEEGGEPLPYFIIMNVEALQMKDAWGKFAMANTIIQRINEGEIGMIAIDEIHKNMSPQCNQGKVCLRIKRETGSKCEWIPITGTPITNKPTDVYLPLRLVDGHEFKNYYSWCQYFCVYGGYGNHQIIAYKHIPELKELLQGKMIRRLKSTVYKDMPSKVRYVEYVENTPTQKKLYRQVQNELKKDKDEIMKASNPLVKFIRLRQVNGQPELIDETIKAPMQMSIEGADEKYIGKNAKLKRLLELLEDIKERGEKTIIYSQWVEPLKMIEGYLKKKYDVVMFTGQMADEERQESKKRFVNDPRCTIILGTIGALGTAHTLTVADDVIFYDEPWSAVDKLQAEDRAYGLDTKKELNIFTLITKDTIDETVYKLLETKEGVSDFIVDNKLDLKKNPKLLDMLLD